MNVLIALLIVIGLAAFSYLGSMALGPQASQHVFGQGLPLIALIVFLAGVVWRIWTWAKVPVPFKIPTTAGQGKSLSFIKNQPLESPHTGWGVVGRMALEVLFFRSLFRNTRTELRAGPKIAYGSNEWLWLAGLVFHYSFLVIFLRHFRLFLHPVPEWVNVLGYLDGFFQIGVPVLYITDVTIVLAVTYLFLRRVWAPTLRYISLVNDYLPLFIILGIALSGISMRYWTKVDVVYVKELVNNMLVFGNSNWFYIATTTSGEPASIDPMFFTHLFLVSALITYFPFSKLTHMVGVFLSPTRNMPNDNRMNRHINPWNPKVKLHTYEEYEDEFRGKMKACGLPLDHDEEPAPAEEASGGEGDEPTGDAAEEPKDEGAEKKAADAKEEE